MKKMNTFAARAWRPALVAISLGLIAYLLYFHNIVYLLPGYDAREIRVYGAAADWHTILSNPVNAPYKLVVWIGIALGHHSILQTRLTAAAFGVMAALLFYIIAYYWYGFRTAFLSTILFATSAGFLHVARLGSAQIMQMSILLYMAALLGYRRLTRHKLVAGYALVALLAILAYIPGMIWIGLLGLLFVRAGVLRQLRRMPKLHIAMLVGIGLLLLTPLIRAIILKPSVAQSVLGLPPTIATFSDVPAKFISTLLSVGIRSSGDPEFFVGHAPLLNIVELVLGMFGVYAFAKRRAQLWTKFLFGSLGLAVVLISFGGTVGTALLLPLLYLCVASGLKSLLRDWLKVFPRNPIAKYAGIGLVCVMVSFSVLYQVRSYFVAWPHNPATRKEFNLRQPQV